MSTSDGVQRESTGLGYVRSFDGLRALSLVIVILYHNDFSWLHGGFFAVTTFFTLSGFLITSLLLAEHDSTGSIALKKFWARRVRRLVPASIATVGVIVALALAHVWTATQTKSLTSEVPAAVLNVFNWHLAFSDRSYSQLFTNPSPLNHFWSLAIEEQFYLVFPLLAAWLLKTSKRRFALVLGAIAVSSFCWSIWLSTRGNLDRVYLGTDTRIAELLIGALGAVWYSTQPRQLHQPGRTRLIREALALGALAVAVWAWTTSSLDDPVVYRGGLVLYAVLTLLLIVTALQNGVLSKLLSSAPLVALGRVSYTMYLVHWPIHMLITPQAINASKEITAVFRAIATLVVGLLLHYLVEQPVRLPKSSIGRIFGPAVTSFAAVTLLIGTPLTVRPNATQIANEGAFEGGIPDPIRQRSAADGPFGDNNTPEPTPSDSLRVLVVGDSVAHGLAYSLYNIADDNKIQIIDGTSTSCGTIRDGESAIFTEWVPNKPSCNEWENKLTEFRPDLVVFIRSLADLANRRLDGTEIHIGQPEYDQRWNKQMSDDIAKAQSSGATVVLTAPPRLSPDYADGGLEDRYPLLVDMIQGQLKSSKATFVDLQQIVDKLKIVERFDKVHMTVKDNDRVAKAWLTDLTTAASAARSAR